MNKTVIECNGIAAGYVKGLNILQGIDMIINEKEIVSIIGPNGNFSSLPDISKWILTVGMILGRLELFAILVLFLPSFWRN